MKITSTKYKYEKVIDKIVEFDLNEDETIYLTGRSGGRTYIAAIIPVHYEVYSPNTETLNWEHYGFTFFSAVNGKEGNVTISKGGLQDDSTLVAFLKNIPHHKDILDWLKGEEDDYRHRIMSEEDFHYQLKAWRAL